MSVRHLVHKLYLYDLFYRPEKLQDTSDSATFHLRPYQHSVLLRIMENSIHINLRLRDENERSS